MGRKILALLNLGIAGVTAFIFFYEGQRGYGRMDTGPVLMGLALFAITLTNAIVLSTLKFGRLDFAPFRLVRLWFQAKEAELKKRVAAN
jgi:hypothetical protein